MDDKPKHRSGYTAEATQLVRSACLTVAVTLGAHLDDVVIVGGLVPSLLIDAQRAEPDQEHEDHPGTNDLDLGLSLALLDDERYAKVSQRLRAEGFEPDENDNGNQTVQRWRRDGLKVDFLMPPPPGTDDGDRLQHLESDFGALITPGLQLAFDEYAEIGIEGVTLTGEAASRTMRVCGPGAFTVLKSLAFADRGEPKDAYDLVYVLRGTPGRADAVGAVLRRHASANPDVVERAVGLLSRDFASPEHIGPRRAAGFEYLEPEELDEAAADAHGHVDDLLKAYRS